MRALNAAEPNEEGQEGIQLDATSTSMEAHVTHQCFFLNAISKYVPIYFVI